MQQTAIIAFAARYHSNLPFQDAQPTMLKEYLPGARSLGCNELQLLNHLCTMPSHKWKAAYAALSADPPIVPLLGKHPALWQKVLWQKVLLQKVLCKLTVLWQKALCNDTSPDESDVAVKATA